MFELIIFLIVSFFTYKILSILLIKLKGEKLGCISFTFTIFITIIISLSISKKLNPNKAESFFFRGEITKKIEDYKSNYKHKNKEFLHQISENNYYNFENKISNTKEIKIGCVCKDGKIISSLKDEPCLNNGGFYEFISIEIDNFNPPKDENRTFYSIPETSNSGGPVYVRGYYRKDGTYVRSHTRRSPRR